MTLAGGGRAGDVRHSAVMELRPPGKAVQVDPIKSTLKVPETKRWNLKYDRLLSKFAFNFNWRRYILAQHPRVADKVAAEANAVLGNSKPTAADYSRLLYSEARAYTPPLFS